jgi:hypothetical protein
MLQEEPPRLAGTWRGCTDAFRAANSSKLANRPRYAVVDDRGAAVASWPALEFRHRGDKPEKVSLHCVKILAGSYLLYGATGSMTPE